MQDTDGEVRPHLLMLADDLGSRSERQLLSNEVMKPRFPARYDKLDRHTPVSLFPVSNVRCRLCDVHCSCEMVIEPLGQLVNYIRHPTIAISHRTAEPL